MNYINNIVEIAKENSLLKKINKRTEKKKKLFESRKKKYWKLSASERLHYDSRREKIENDYDIFVLSLTIAKMIGILFIGFLLFKLLFELDRSIFINITLSLFPVIILIFKVSIVLDIFTLIVEHGIYKRHRIKRLEKNYGFK